MKTILPFLLIAVVWNISAQTLPRLVVPTGHTNAVSAVAFTPDGKYVLTGSRDNNAKLWDLSGHEILTFAAHKQDILAVAVSQDGQFVLTGSTDGSAKLWNRAGKVLRTFYGHRDWIRAVAFSPDGQYVLTGCGGRKDNSAKLWNRTGADRDSAILTLPHPDWVLTVAFSPDGQFFLTGCKDKTAKLWDVKTRKFARAFPAGGAVTSVAFSPADGGKTLLVGSDDGAAKLWNRDQAGKPIRPAFIPDGKVTAVAFSPDGKTIATGTQYGTVTLWEAVSGRKKEPVYEGHGNSAITSIGFSPICHDDPAGGRFLASGSTDGTARVWTPAGATIQVLNNHSNIIKSVAWAPDGKSILTGSEDKTAKLWDLQSDEVRIFPMPDKVTSVAYAPDGNSILVGCFNGSAKLWNLNDDTVRVFKGHSNLNAVSVAFTADGNYVLTGSTDRTAILWNRNDPAKAQPVRTFEHTEPVNGVASARGATGINQILTGSDDKSAKIWGADGSERHTIEAQSQVRAVAFSSDGKYVLTGTYSGKVLLWDNAGEPIQTYERHKDKINAVAFSPAPTGGNQILTGGDDDIAILWNTESADTIRTFKHPNEVTSVAFSTMDNGKTILTGCKDGAVRFWDAGSGKLRATLVALDSAGWVVITPQGLFDALPESMNLMYYAQGSEVIELNQLKKRYWEPSLLAKIIKQEPLRDVADFDAKPLPLYPEIDANISGDTLYIRLTQREGGLGKVSLVVGHKEVATDINPAPNRKSRLSVNLNRFAEYYVPGENTIALRAFTGDGLWPSQDYRLPYTRAASARGDDTGGPGNTVSSTAKNSSLYAIVIGTSKYNKSMFLTFPDKDAAYMKEALEAAGKGMFGNRVEVRLLSTADGTPPDQLATKKNIETAFEEIRAKAKSTDILVVYFSGHGLTKNNQFYYLTKDVQDTDMRDTLLWQKTTVSQQELTSWLKNNYAQKQVVIFDACNSGSFAQNFDPTASKDITDYAIKAFDEMKGVTGTYILAGSAGDKVSYEASKYGQGLLTYSLLQGMSFAALNENRVDVSRLFDHACITVPKLAAGIGKSQKPERATPKGGAPIFIGVVDKDTKMPKLPDPKDLFIRPKFGVLPDNDDPLGIEGALIDEFVRLTARGATAPIFYIDREEAGQSESAYKVSGTYTIKSNGEVELKGSLKKGKMKVDDFTVKGHKDKMPEMITALSDTVLDITAKQRALETEKEK